MQTGAATGQSMSYAERDMNQIRRSAILKLSARAHEMRLGVINGVLHRDEGGRWLVGERDLLRWLAEYEEKEIALILGDLSEDRPVPTRTCRTCGRDYQDMECPTCRANRQRLRGENY